MFSLVFSQDICQILTPSEEGRRILENLVHDSIITVKQRSCLVRIVVSHLIEKFGEKYFRHTHTGNGQNACSDFLISSHIASTMNHAIT